MKNLLQQFKPKPNQPREKAILGAGLIVLSGTWLALFSRVAALAERWLAARPLADFFAQEVGGWLPASMFVLLSVGLFWHKMGQTAGTGVFTPWWFGTTNLLFCLASLALDFFASFPAWPVLLILALNLFIFQSRINMGALRPITLSRRWEVGLVLGVDGLILGGLLWVGVIRTALIWLDRLFYPYTPVVMIGVALLVLLLIMIGTLAANQPPLVAEGYDSTREDGGLF